MTNILCIAAGGAAGALARYWTARGVHLLLGSTFPWGTLIVNVSGSLVIGVLYVVMVERGSAPPEWHAALVVGFLGAYTTFSSFSMETLRLVEAGQYLAAALNVLGSVLLCLLACGAGLHVGRALIHN
jgi:CrcB protein